MAWLTKGDMRARGNRVLQEQRRLAKSARAVLVEATTFDPSAWYDVFLSHSSRDKTLVLGVKNLLEEGGFSAYVDWIDDPEFDRADVTMENAQRLRLRIARCFCLLYLTTENAVLSRWMPWEIGYFDGGTHGTIGILPILDDAEAPFEGIEFLGLYPLVEVRRLINGAWALYVQQPNGALERLRPHQG
jgi:TIR domain